MAKIPTIVRPSPGIEDAVKIAGRDAFVATGQTCTAYSRAIVHEPVRDEFIEGIVTYAEKLEIGPGLYRYDMGPHVIESDL